MTKTRDLANLGRGFKQTNTNITRTVQSKLQDTVSVLDFIPETEHSAIKNGTSIYNATNDIQAAIDSISGSGSGSGTITFPGGIYRVSNSLTISSSNIHLDLGTATILANGFTGWDETPGTNFSGNRNRGLIRFVGTSVLKTECSDESLLKTALSLNLNSTAGVRAGDLLYLESDETWYGGADKIEIHRIIKVDVSTVYLASPLYHSYNVSGNVVSVEIIRPVENCSISGGIIEGEGRVAPLLNGFGPCGVEAKGVSNFKIYDSVIKYFQNKALALNWAIQSSANNLMIIGHKDEYNLDPVETNSATPDEQKGYSSFYAIFTGQCYGINLTGIRGNRVRHLTDGSNTHKSVISDCHCTYTWTSTYRTHAGCTDFTYKGCTSAAQHYGMQWGGFDLTVSNCHFVATDGAGGRYGITDDNSDATSPQKTIRLFNNIIEAGTRAIYLRSNVKGIIQGNKFINNGNQTSGLIQLGSEVMNGLAFKDNIFEDPTGTRSVQIIDGGSNGDTLEFIGNTFSYKDNGEDPPSMNSPISVQRTYRLFISNQGSGYTDGSYTGISLRVKEGSSSVLPIIDATVFEGKVTEITLTNNPTFDENTIFELPDPSPLPEGGSRFEATGVNRDQLNIVAINNVCPSGATNVITYSHRTGGLLQVSNNYSGSTTLTT